MTDPALERGALVAALSEQWDALAALVADLDETRWRTPSPLPGWTVFDIVSHVIGTESWLLGERPPACEPGAEDIDVHTLPHVRNETGAGNEIWVRRLRPQSGAAQLRQFGEVTALRRKALASLDEAAWAAPTMSPIGEVSYGRFMRVRQFDCWMHELDIADALGVRIDEGGTRGELAFAEFLASIPRVLVKRGGAPQGSRITCTLGGPLARTLHIQVGDRAAYVDAFDGPVTVEIGMDSGLFARLGGGRTAADQHLDEITLRGNEQLGLQLVRNLAFTI